MMILVCMLVLTGCKKPNFSVVVNEDNTASIDAVKAPKGYFGGAGSIEIGEGQKIVVESKMSGKSEVSLRFTSDAELNADSGVAELTEVASGENAILEITLKGTETAEYDLASGFYFIGAEVKEKASGTVLISVR